MQILPYVCKAEIWFTAKQSNKLHQPENTQHKGRKYHCTVLQVWIQQLHYIQIKTYFTFLVKSSFIKLETSCTMTL